MTAALVPAIVSTEAGRFRFPKSARLRKSRDFQFRPYKRYQSELFRFIYAPQGQGRLGISLSKKVLRHAIARNRVRRLLREAFRLRPGVFVGVDVHVIGQPALTDAWPALTREAVGRELDRFLETL